MISCMYCTCDRYVLSHIQVSTNLPYCKCVYLYTHLNNTLSCLQSSIDTMMAYFDDLLGIIGDHTSFVMNYKHL